MSVSRRVLDALSPSEPIYAVLDGARDSRIVPWLIGTQAPAWCLYSGDLPFELEMAAPWLLRLGRGHAFTRELFDLGWGNAWGFFLSSPAPGRAVRQQLRRHLLVRSEEGQRLVFRYYDPRVLRVYLPTCTADELRRFLGPITAVAAEKTDGSELIVRHPDGAAAPLVARPARSRIDW